LAVEPTEQDIKKIELLGHRRMNFLRKGKLRKSRGLCMFFEKKNGQGHCKIHEMKPKVCRDYPYTVMGRDRLFSCPGLRIQKSRK
jgi:Fe-S-cluster containining protein